MPFPLTFLVEKNSVARPTKPDPESDLIVFYLILSLIMQSKGLETQALKRFYKPLITLPKERLPIPSTVQPCAPSFCTLSY